MSIVPQILDRWQHILDEIDGHEEFTRERSDRERQRFAVLTDMQAVLKSFVSGEYSIEYFRSTFQQKSAKGWESFGLSGFAGAMFLNTLVKHVPDQERITHELRSTLPLPKNEIDGRKKLQSFVGYLSNLTRRAQLENKKSRLGTLHSLSVLGGTYNRSRLGRSIMFLRVER